MSAKCMFQSPTCYRSCWRMRQRWFWWDFCMKLSVPVSSCSRAVPNRSADEHENVTFSKWWAPPATSRPFYIHPSFLLLAEMDACYSYHHCLQPECPGFSLEIFAVFLCLFVCLKDLAGYCRGPIRSSATLNQTLLFNLPSGPNSVAAVAAACVAEAENCGKICHKISAYKYWQRDSRGFNQLNRCIQLLVCSTV